MIFVERRKYLDPDRSREHADPFERRKDFQPREEVRQKLIKQSRPAELPGREVEMQEPERWDGMG